MEGDTVQAHTAREQPLPATSGGDLQKVEGAVRPKTATWESPTRHLQGSCSTFLQHTAQTYDRLDLVLFSHGSNQVDRIQ